MSEFSSEQGHNESMRQAIEYAKNEALSEDELESLKDRHDVLVRDFLSGTIDQQEYDRQSKETVSSRGVISFESPSEFKLALELIGFPADFIEEMYGHEMAHYEVAVRRNFNPKIQIQFLRDESGKISLYPSVVLSWTPTLPDDEVRAMVREVGEAPDDMSPRDKNQFSQSTEDM